MLKAIRIGVVAATTLFGSLFIAAPIQAASLTPAPLAVSIADVPIAQQIVAAKAAKGAFMICQHLDGTGTCWTYYQNTNGSRVYSVGAPARNEATSIVWVMSGVTWLNLRGTNIYGWGMGGQCNSLSTTRAWHYIGDGCNDKLGAVVL